MRTQSNQFKSAGIAILGIMKNCFKTISVIGFAGIVNFSIGALAKNQPQQQIEGATSNTTAENSPQMDKLPSGEIYQAREVSQSLETVESATASNPEEPACDQPFLSRQRLMSVPCSPSRL